MAGLVNVHFLLGSFLVLAFVLLAVLYGLTAAGRAIPGVRTFAMIAAVALLAQYLVGFVLLASGFRNAWLHYVIALLAIATVGLEHGYAARRATASQRATAAAVAAAGTAILMLVAHGLGSANAGGEAAALLTLPW